MILKVKGARSEEFMIIRKRKDLFKHIKRYYWRMNIKFAVDAVDFNWHIIYIGICVGSLIHPVVSFF